MAQGLFTLRQQVQGIVQKAWNTPVGTYAGSFNGSSQYLSLPSIAAYTLSADFTIEFWVNATSYPSTGGGSPTVLSGTNTLNNWLVLVDSGTIAFYWNQTEIVSGGTTNIVGSWFHVAVVRSGSTVTIYKNGTRLNSATNASSFTLTSPLFIGQQNTGVGYWAGLISNVRIVKGTAVYTQNFAPPTTPLAAITNTSLLTLQNATIIDNSTNAATITNGGSVTTGAAMPFTQLKTPAVDYLVVAGGGGGGNGNAGGGGGAGGLLQGTVPVTAGSAITVTVGSGGAGGALSLSDNTLAGSVGQNSVFGSISATGGGGGGASGVSSSAGGSGGGSGGSANNQVGGSQRIAGQGNKGGVGNNINYPKSGGGGGAGTVGQDYYYNASGPQFSGNGGAGIASAISGTVSAYSGGGGGGGDYRGTTVTTTTTGGSGGGGAGSLTTTGTNGSPNTGGGGGGGGLSLSPTTFYAGGTGGSGIVIVSYPDIYAGAAATTGSPTVSTTGSGSINFVRASSQYLTFSNSGSQFSFGTGAFTIECWVNPTTLPSSTGYPAGYWMFGGGVVNSNTGIDFYINNTQIGFNLVTFLTPTAIGNHGMIANSWYHVAVVRGGTSNQTVSIYVNGARVATATSVTDTADPSLTGISISAAEPSGATSGNFNGYISNHRIVKGTAVYDPTLTTLTVPTTPLTAITNTQLLLSTVSGAQFADSSTNSLTATALGSPTWNQASPFATGLGYKNRVYTYTGSGSITF